MPKNKKVWSSWNVFSDKGMNKVSLTYWMNKLQNIDYNYPIFVTLNPLHLPDKRKIFEIIDYEHPIYDETLLMVSKELKNIQGYKNCWFAGAWTGNGFHEAGSVIKLNDIGKLKWSNPLALKSLIFEGQVIHKRYHQKKHQFLYNVFNMLIDIDDLIKFG